MSPRPARSRFKHPKLVGCALAGGIALALVGGALGYVYHEVSAPPAVWVREHGRITRMPPANRARLADHFYKRLVTELSSIRSDGPASSAPASAQGGPAPGRASAPSGPRTRRITLRIEAVNAWLAQRMPELLANQGLSLPPQVHQPMLAVEGGHLVAAFRTGGSEKGKVVSVAFDPRVTRGGKARLKLVSVHLGRLPIPRSVALGRVRAPHAGKRARAAARQAARVLGGKGFDPVFPIDQTRRVRVLAIRLKPDAVGLTIRTEPRPGYDGPAR